MLEKSIRMNVDISVKYASIAIGWVVFAFLGLRLLIIPSLIAVLVYAFLVFRTLFDRSMFAEEACTCMMVPISMKDLIVGKTIVACFWMLSAYLLAYLSLGVSALLFQDVAMDWSVGTFLLQDTSGVFDAAENGVIGKDEILYDRGGLLHLAANIILSPFTVLADGVFLCGLFQLGYAVRHVLAPGRDRPGVTVMVAFAGIGTFCLVLAAFVGLDHHISGDVYTVWSVLLELVILGGCGVALLAASVRLLEQKYSLS